MYILDGYPLQGCNSGTCFEAPSSVKDALEDLHAESIHGILMIDDTAVTFSFNPKACDGDIFTSNSIHRQMVKHFVPIMYRAMLDEQMAIMA